MPMSSRSAAGRRGCCARSASHIPVYPVKGYSITVPIADANAAPVSTVMDESYKVAITRLGDRIRVGGTAEDVGLFEQARPRAARDAGSFGDRSVSARRRRRQGHVLVRPAADDAGRPADHRRRRATPTCISTPAMARLAGPWRAARGACWRTCSRTARPTSTRPSSRYTATPAASADGHGAGARKVAKMQRGGVFCI